MDGIFLLLTRHFWAVLLIVTALNAAALRRRFRGFIAQHPERERAYGQMLAWFAGVNVLLWGTMGVGILFGGVPHIFAYLAPASGNPFVLAWHGLYVGLALLGLVWVFFRGGAEFLVDHPGLLRVGGLSPGLVKLWAGLVLLGGLLAEMTLWSLGGGSAGR